MKNNTGYPRNRRFLTFFLTGLVFILWGQLAAGGDGISHKLNSRKPEVLLQALAGGKKSARIIVNLTSPEGLKGPLQKLERARIMQDPARRQALIARVREIQSKVIAGLNPRSVRLGKRFSYLSGFSAEVTWDGLHDLISLEAVESIEEDRILRPHLAQGIALIEADNLSNTETGSGIAIAVCDTGLDYTHPMLGGGSIPNGKVIGGYDFGDDDDDPMDEVGHGTSCAGIAAGNMGTTGDYVGGVAYDAKLYALKITPAAENWGYTSDMVASWEWCITHQQDDPDNPILVISASMGSGRYLSACDGVSTALFEAAANAVAAGITLFVSSGNDGYCDAVSSPACLSDVISVGAVYDSGLGTFYPCVSSDSCATKYATADCESGYYATDSTAADIVPSYSNSSSLLDLLAPSDSTYTTDISGPGGYAHGDYYRYFGGTSASAPYAAGAAACLQGAAKAATGSYLTPAEVRSYLADTGSLVTDEKASVVKPRINLDGAINSALTTPLCECLITPASDTVSLGGTLGFDVSVTNNTGKVGIAKFGTKLERFDGTLTGFIWGPLNLWLNPYQTISGSKQHTVPTHFQLGTYTYHGYVGNYGQIFDQCQFQFEVIAP